MKIVQITAYEDSSPVRSRDKHDTKRDRGGKERLAACVLNLFVRAMTQPGEIDGNGATNDSKLQSSDSQEDSKDDAQSDCSEMADFVSLPHCAVLR